jgi:hypothetical protein
LNLKADPKSKLIWIIFVHTVKCKTVLWFFLFFVCVCCALCCCAACCSAVLLSCCPAVLLLCSFYQPAVKTRPLRPCGVRPSIRPLLLNFWSGLTIVFRIRNETACLSMTGWIFSTLTSKWISIMYCDMIVILTSSRWRAPDLLGSTFRIYDVTLPGEEN